MVCINRKKLNAFNESNSAIIKKLSRSAKNHLEVRYNTDENTIRSYEYSKHHEYSSTSLNDLNLDIISSGSSSSDEEEKQTTVVDVENNDDDDDFDLDMTGRGTVTGCMVFGGQVLCRAERRIPNAKRTLDNIETEDEDPLECQVCKKTFSSKAFLQLHVCKGTSTGQRRDLEHYALSYALEKLIDQHEVANDTNVNIITDEMNHVAASSIGFNSGWARTSKHPGHTYGQKYIDAYKEDVERFFREASGIRPCKIVEKLRKKYPKTLDLPSESEIRNFIKTLTRNECQTVSSRGISMPYIQTVTSIFVNSGGQIKPTEAWKKFQEKHPAPSDATKNSLNYPTMHQVKAKISSMRVAYNKRGVLPAVPE